MNLDALGARCNGARPMTDARAAPVAPGDRIEALDVLRGFALLGILLLNILGFGLPFLSYLNPAADGATSGVNFGVYVTVDALLRGRPARALLHAVRRRRHPLLERQGRRAVLPTPVAAVAVRTVRRLRPALVRGHPRPLRAGGAGPVPRAQLAPAQSLHRFGGGLSPTSRCSMAWCSRRSRYCQARWARSSRPSRQEKP